MQEVIEFEKDKRKEDLVKIHFPSISRSSLKKSKDLASDYKFGDNYQTLQKLGQGTFGCVYKTFNSQTCEQSATKFESKYGSLNSLLKREVVFLTQLKGLPGFPNLISHGKDENYNFLVMDLLGMNLEDLRRKCGGKFSDSTILKIAIQLISSTQKLHAAKILHRDFKPENFAISIHDPTQIITFDFGLSKYYINENGEHIPPSSKKGMIGTAQYTSLQSHLGNEQGRKDDLESLGYVLIFLAIGELPWKRVSIPIKELRNQKIMQSKSNISVDDLCLGAPKVFREYFNYVRKLSFKDQPDYQYLIDLFQHALDTLGVTVKSQPYDWEAFPEIIKQLQSFRILSTLNSRKSTEQFNNFLIVHKNQSTVKSLEIENNQIKQSASFNASPAIYQESDDGKIQTSHEKINLNPNRHSIQMQNFNDAKKNHHSEYDDIHLTSFEIPTIKIPILITHFMD